jgi:hypothetical protein
MGPSGCPRSVMLVPPRFGRPLQGRRPARSRPPASPELLLREPLTPERFIKRFPRGGKAPVGPPPFLSARDLSPVVGSLATS